MYLLAHVFSKHNINTTLQLPGPFAVFPSSSPASCHLGTLCSQAALHSGTRNLAFAGLASFQLCALEVSWV